MLARHGLGLQTQLQLLQLLHLGGHQLDILHVGDGASHFLQLFLVALAHGFQLLVVVRFKAQATTVNHFFPGVFRSVLNQKFQESFDSGELC